jgi:hemerythrin-like metal-binding protein
MKTEERVSWQYEYSVEVTEIDTQHRELMDMVNDMIDHSTDPQGERKIFFQGVIGATYNHLAKHFDTEERMLVKAGYDKLAEHRKEHEKLSAKVKDIRSELENNNEDTAMRELIMTFKEYFQSHILMYDKEAKDYFKAGSKTTDFSGFQAGIF